MAWSAWSIWRGDVRLLAHVARSAVAEVEERSGSKPQLSIRVVVRDDTEEFSSADDLVEHISPQAVRRFNRLTIRAETSDCGVDVQIARRKVREAPFGNRRGVVIRAWSCKGDQKARGDAAAAMCDRLRVAVRRGSMPWTRGLKETETEPLKEIAQRLKWLEYRRTYATFAIVLAIASIPFYVLLAVVAFTEVDERSVSEVLTYVIFAQVPIGVVAFFVARLVMPPIDLAELTPGRRYLQLIGKSGLLTVVAGLAVALAKDQFGME